MVSKIHHEKSVLIDKVVTYFAPVDDYTKNERKIKNVKQNVVEGKCLQKENFRKLIISNKEFCVASYRSSRCE